MLLSVIDVYAIFRLVSEELFCASVSTERSVILTQPLTFSSVRCLQLTATDVTPVCNALLVLFEMVMRCGF